MDNQWREIRDPATGKLLAKIDPRRLLLQIGHRRKMTVIDLRDYLIAKCEPPDVKRSYD